MKIIAIVVVLFSFSFAQSLILEVNDQDMKVYIHPTPTMEIGLQDLGSDGGLLYLSLVYDGIRIKSELAEIQSQYPNHQLQVIASNRGGNATLNIQGIIYQEIPTLQQQLGPQINTQLLLNRGQVAKIKHLGTDLQSSIMIGVPAKLSITSSQIIEVYKAKPSFCQDLGISTVMDLVLNFGKMKKPEAITLQSTFDSFKIAALTKCFAIHEMNARSFVELMDNPVTINTPEEPIVGLTSQKKELNKDIMIQPYIKIQIN
jgi:hypothetical protein